MLPWAKIFHPSLLARQWIRKQPDWSLATKLDLDWFPFPQYAYALNAAATQARALGIARIRAITVGIGDGAGAAALEAIAAELEPAHSVQIDLIATDFAEGRSASNDPRDQPYAFGPRPLELPTVESKLKRTRLVLGDLAETLPTLLDPATPIGFVGFDLGYYTTTATALALFNGLSESRLPRTFACFANTIGSDDQLNSEHAGELLAIAEFNRTHERRKLAAIHGLRHKRVFQASWCDEVYVLHDFGHPQYNTPLLPTNAPPTADEASRDRPKE